MSLVAECRNQNGCWSDDAASVANARLIAEAPALLGAVSGLLSFTGQMTPSQFIDALYSIGSPGLELCDRNDLVGKLDAAQAAAWSAVARATGAAQ